MPSSIAELQRSTLRTANIILVFVSSETILQCEPVDERYEEPPVLADGHRPVPYPSDLGCSGTRWRSNRISS